MKSWRGIGVGSMSNPEMRIAMEKTCDEKLMGHVCFYCYHKSDQSGMRSKENPARTDWCAICGHRGEGIKRILSVVDRYELCHMH